MGGYVTTFLLAIYGGFFRGGFVTLLTTAFVLLFGMTLFQSIATTKVVNIFSSVVAVLIFAWRGADGRVTTKINTLWFRQIFVAAVLGLALKMFFNLIEA